MPETRVEKGLFVLGVLAIAALGFLIARLWHHTHGAAASPPPSQSVPARTSPGSGSTGGAATTTGIGSLTPAQTTTPGKTAKTRPTTTTAAPAGVISLLLTAKADTWLEVRSSSSTGSILYSGTLAAGATKIFRARAIWARFGAAGNLSARLDQKEFRLPSGTYDATFGVHGFQQLHG